MLISLHEIRFDSLLCAIIIVFWFAILRPLFMNICNRVEWIFDLSHSNSMNNNFPLLVEEKFPVVLIKVSLLFADCTYCVSLRISLSSWMCATKLTTVIRKGGVILSSSPNSRQNFHFETRSGVLNIHSLLKENVDSATKFSVDEEENPHWKMQI